MYSSGVQIKFVVLVLGLELSFSESGPLKYILYLHVVHGPTICIFSLTEDLSIKIKKVQNLSPSAC